MCSSQTVFTRGWQRLHVRQEEVDLLAFEVDGREIPLETFTLGEVTGRAGGLFQVHLSDKALEDAHRRAGQLVSARVLIGRGGPRLPLDIVFLEPFLDAIVPEGQEAGAPVAVVVCPFIRVCSGLTEYDPESHLPSWVGVTQ